LVDITLRIQYSVIAVTDSNPKYTRYENIWPRNLTKVALGPSLFVSLMLEIRVIDVGFSNAYLGELHSGPHTMGSTFPGVFTLRII
jgi:hypothetical protein